VRVVKTAGKRWIKKIYITVVPAGTSVFWDVEMFHGGIMLINRAVVLQLKLIKWRIPNDDNI
jgi:hypothetical protein